MRQGIPGALPALSPVLSLALSLALAWPAYAAHTHAAHEHGVARLNIAVEEDGVLIELDSPLENFLGFEHAPATPAQREAVRDMARRLRAAEAIFAFTPAARCAPASVTLESEALDPALLEGTTADAAPAGQGKEPAEAHGDLEAAFRFVCAEPGRLNGVDVRLFEAYGGLREIEVQLVAPGGQAAVELTPQATTVSW